MTGVGTVADCTKTIERGAELAGEIAIGGAACGAVVEFDAKLASDGQSSID